MKKVSYFVLRTMSNKYEFRNLTMDELRQSIKSVMPKITDESINRLFSNPSNFAEPKAVVEPKSKKIGGRTNGLATLPTTSNKFVKTYKELFKLANSLYAYHKNGYRQWGCVVNEIIEDSRVTPSLYDFDKAFENVYKAMNKNDDTATLNGIATLIECMKNFRSVMVSHKALRDYADMEFINGTDRRLGMQVILDRIPSVIELKKAA